MTLILFIISQAIQIIESQLSGKKLDIPEAILAIISAGYSAYEAQTGKPLDPALIKPYVPIP